MEGFDDVEKGIASSRIPYRNGAVAHGDPYSPPRVLSVAIDLGAASAIDIRALCRARRTAVSPYKAAETPGILVLEDLDSHVDRAIECWCVRMREVYRGPAARRLIYHFWAEDAFFYDPIERVETLAVAGGGLIFPITFPITFASGDIDDTLVVDNIGDAPTWPTIRIYGPGENPSLENTTTGKVFALTQVLETDDYVDIDMEAALVTFYDASLGTTTSISQAMTDASEFWALQVGENSIDVTVEEAVSGSVRFSYYLRYLGI